MSNGNQDGPDIGAETLEVSGAERWRLYFGKGTIFHVADPPVPPTPAVHLASDHFPASTMRALRDLLDEEGTTYDDLIDELGSYAADFADVPNGDQSAVVPRLAYMVARLVISEE
jgi:hypothetical protein